MLLNKTLDISRAAGFRFYALIALVPGYPSPKEAWWSKQRFLVAAQAKIASLVPKEGLIWSTEKLAGRDWESCRGGPREKGTFCN